LMDRNESSTTPLNTIVEEYYLRAKIYN